ncbi:protein SIEVE ELEMENT OCCLUSION B [Citrus sinensis]|uniref:Protein SIEVE ELEMENT OCCLUSION B n=1 Tax=Citrus sinensis TaxID=2711 RepID=A0ACB8LSW3_CITSI|nr:protein SIEVE ELEMENT OCCLUSION B [Citrus sinensis]
MQEVLARSKGRMLSATDDSAMMKQVQASHAPDGREVDVRPILSIIEDIFRRATPSTIDGVGTSEHVDALDKNASPAALSGMLDVLSCDIRKISCEISCKCSGGEEAHATTMDLFNILSVYSWDAKMVLSLAAFALNYGQFWLGAQLCNKNSLAKSMAVLKQLPNVLEHFNALKPQLDALIEVMLDLTKCIVEFKQLPSQYISTDAQAMSTAMADTPAAAYWTFRSIVACHSQILSLAGLRDAYTASNTDAWELATLAHRVSRILEHFKKLIAICYQQIDENRQIEAYHNLVRLLETIHMDNMKVLRALIYAKDDIQPVVDGFSRTRVNIDVLRRKHVLLLISSLDLSAEEILVLDQLYTGHKAQGEFDYAIVWLPILDRSTAWDEGYRQKFEQLQAMMPWYTVQHPTIIEPAVVKYVKEVWKFSKKTILVPVDPQGRILNQNAFHMLWIWGNLAFPFSAEKEAALWKAESWRLELLIDDIDSTVLEWMKDERFICLYGGEDIEWIRRFTTSAKAVARAAQINLGMAYVGKNNAKERFRKISRIVIQENLSHTLTDPAEVWFFWARLESMLYSKLQHGATVENDHIMQEVMTILSFDGSEQGWAIFWRGTTHEMARAKGEMAVDCMMEFEKWKDDADQMGFVAGLNNYLQRVHTPRHCNRLILPDIHGPIPERLACAECGRTMEMFFMYRCCPE